ncbi:excisionase [Mycoplasmopsis gallinacea]|uniref:excisionase n=1 Tax=Mycoplasmopsis gallinacea TaxID=29556 RepID=UPI003FCE8402
MSFAKAVRLLVKQLLWNPNKWFGKEDFMKQTDIPIWERYTLTIEEASKYFRIGENKLRRLAEENKNANWLIMNGNRIQIKRKQFEKIIDTLDAI